MLFSPVLNEGIVCRTTLVVNTDRRPHNGYHGKTNAFPPEEVLSTCSLPRSVYILATQPITLASAMAACGARAHKVDVIESKYLLCQSSPSWLDVTS